MTNKTAKASLKPGRHNHPMIAITLVAAVVFVLGSELIVILVAAHNCVVTQSCAQLDGLSHVVTAWAGAIIGGAISHFLGSD